MVLIRCHQDGMDAISMVSIHTQQLNFLDNCQCSHQLVLLSCYLHLLIPNYYCMELALLAIDITAIQKETFQQKNTEALLEINMYSHPILTWDIF